MLSSADLKKELAKREAQEAKSKIPKLLAEPNLQEISDYAKEIMAYIAKYGDFPKDSDNYMMETVMNACFGKGVYDYINEKMQSR
jgi:hypothetical protein